MFVQILNQVTEQTNRECQGSRYVRDYLIHAIAIWCNELTMPPDITDYILRGYRQHQINELTAYIYQEWEPKPKEKFTFSGREKYYELSKLYSIVNKTIFNQINMRSENMKFIVLIAFGITAVGYFIYIFNQQKQQKTARREEPRPDNPNPLATSISTVQTPPIPTTPVQTITKQFLVLVVSALQADFLESLAAKRHINSNDGEAFYDITKYLWLGFESEFSQRTANINRYSVSKGEESEYDIYLVYLELKQADEGFNPTVNQLDRYDAFRKLADLAVNLTISPRLQMEAYGNFEVYSR